MKVQDEEGEPGEERRRRMVVSAGNSVDVSGRRRGVS